MPHPELIVTYPHPDEPSGAPMWMADQHLLVDLVTTVEEYMAAVESDCEYNGKVERPPDIECPCEVHVTVRALHIDLEELLTKIKGA